MLVLTFVLHITLHLTVLNPSHLSQPCRLCPHVVVAIGLERLNDLWGYAVEPLMPDRFKVRFQTKRYK